MRNYEHELFPDGSILKAACNSLKSRFGLGCPEAFGTSNPHFLEEVKSGDRLAFVVSPPTKGFESNNGMIMDGFQVVEEQQPSGFFTELMCHKSRIKR